METAFLFAFVAYFCEIARNVYVWQHVDSFGHETAESYMYFCVVPLSL
jgi:hypothetical protein